MAATVPLWGKFQTAKKKSKDFGHLDRSQSKLYMVHGKYVCFMSLSTANASCMCNCLTTPSRLFAVPVLLSFKFFDTPLPTPHIAKSLRAMVGCKLDKNHLERLTTGALLGSPFLQRMHRRQKIDKRS